MMNLKVKVYSGCKYDLASKKVKEHTYNDVIDFEVKKISDEEIYKEGYDEVDEAKEYAIMTFADGSIATFRNSHVDIFRV
jgi:hypothetical protein